MTMSRCIVNGHKALGMLEARDLVAATVLCTDDRVAVTISRA